MPNQTEEQPSVSLPKRSELLDHPHAPKVIWAAILCVSTVVAWGGKTLLDSVQAAWNAQARIEAIKAEVLQKANDNTQEKLAGYLPTQRFLEWQVKFEQEERRRDREKLADLKALLQAQGR